MESLLQLILEKSTNSYPVGSLILMGLGTLVVAGTSYIAATPSLEDDAFLAKLEDSFFIGLILRSLKRFSVIQRKEPQKELEKKPEEPSV